eukprot:271754-Chlamydomonas_euryale.AAC.7
MATNRTVVMGWYEMAAVMGTMAMAAMWVVPRGLCRGGFDRGWVGGYHRGRPLRCHTQECRPHVQ